MYLSEDIFVGLVGFGRILMSNSGELLYKMDKTECEQSRLMIINQPLHSFQLPNWLYEMDSFAK